MGRTDGQMTDDDNMSVGAFRKAFRKQIQRNVQNTFWKSSERTLLQEHFPGKSMGRRMACAPITCMAGACRAINDINELKNVTNELNGMNEYLIYTPVALYLVYICGHLLIDIIIRYISYIYIIYMSLAGIRYIIY